ncbi:MAG: multiple sugar transport system substrate-binding protein, partial [Yoonia sp.]
MDILKRNIEMSDSRDRPETPSTRDGQRTVLMQDIQKTATSYALDSGDQTDARASDVDVLNFLQAFNGELELALSMSSPNPFFNMAIFLIRSHTDGRLVTASTLIAASDVPYATGRRKMEEMVASGLIEQRPRTKSGKTFSLHPSSALLDNWGQFADRIVRLAGQHLGAASGGDYYFGDSYMSAQSIKPPQVLTKPLALAGGLRILVHGDPTFMVMENLKRQFEQVVGVKINQRAFSIDRLHEEVLRNAERKASRYDIIAVDLPWIGEFAEKNILLPLDDVLDTNRLDPSDFHTAGWKGAHWGGRPYGVPSQTTPELLFYRKDWFAEAGIEPPSTTDEVLRAAELLHDPRRGRYGVAWNAARGTALGHEFMMACAACGQPVLNLTAIAGGFDADVA